MIEKLIEREEKKEEEEMAEKLSEGEEKKEEEEMIEGETSEEEDDMVEMQWLYAVFVDLDETR